MANKKVTPHQLRKNLAYVSNGPDFMRMLTGQSANAANNDPRNPYRKPIGIEAKFQTDQEDDDDDGYPEHDILNEREEERPTVVVLKDGKHLDESQVRNILNKLPPGLSDAEIQKRLAEETEKLGKESESESEDDQDPMDSNGKILFRRPKGSKSKSKKEISNTSSSNDNNKKQSLDEIVAEEAAKKNSLKRKPGQDSAGSSSSSSAASTKGVKTANQKDGKTSSGTGDNSSSSSITKKKKQKTAKPATSLLSFDDDE
ncbi:hypothetical protein BGZ76_006741 [Entomortierella beljakovae]|nr:hypothetical protein BGZ76_006741 [Entomortierella beljakovae]